MIGFDPYARQPRLTVPTPGQARVEASTDAPAPGGDERRRALVPVGPRRDGGRSSADPASSQAGVREACVRAGLALQIDAPAPRRGLRADAVERNRYRRAYETAGRAFAAAPAPRLERVA